MSPPGNEERRPRPGSGARSRDPGEDLDASTVAAPADNLGHVHAELAWYRANLVDAEEECARLAMAELGDLELALCAWIGLSPEGERRLFDELVRRGRQW